MRRRPLPRRLWAPLAGPTLVACAAGASPDAADAGTGAAGMGGGPPPEPERPVFDPGPMDAVLPAMSGDDWHARDDAALAALARMYATGTGQFTSGPRWSYPRHRLGRGHRGRSQVAVSSLALEARPERLR